MTNSEKNLRSYTDEKLSTRSSMFAWLVCALLGWALAFTSFYSLTGEDSEINTNREEFFASEAEKMEQIAPAAGDSN